MDIETLFPGYNIGSIMPDDAALLQGLIKAIKPHYIVEIGTYVGTSTLVMANTLMEIQSTSKIYTVDQNDHEVMDKAKDVGLDDKIEFFQQDSFEFAKEIVEKLPFIDFIFYDGEPHVDQYLRHFDLLKKKMKSGGIYAVHDAFSRNDHGVFLERIEESYVTIPTDKGITLIQI